MKHAKPSNYIKTTMLIRKNNIILSRIAGSSHIFIYNNMDVIPTKQERIVIYLN